jgi:hypothetical protein
MTKLKPLTKLPTVRAMRLNILAVFGEADHNEIANGLQWYQRAREEAEYLAQSYGMESLEVMPTPSEWDREVEKAAAVIAVLSPRLSWPKNVELARLAYEWRATEPGSTVPPLDYWPGLKGNAAKAFRILSGENPDDVVSGPKVRAFWHTIVDPTDPRAVVVDRHAFDVAVNRVMTDKERGVLLGRKGAYDLIAKTYTDAADVINGQAIGWEVTPAGVQAVTWDLWRRTRASAYHGD